jgi:predicted helicase
LPACHPLPNLRAKSLEHTGHLDRERSRAVEVVPVEIALIQHLLTERIFRKIFDVGDFMQRNNIAAEIEKVVTALTIRSFSRDQFLRELDRFYKAIEDAAGTIQEFSEKQKFLNTVYEQFFHGFAVKRADTMGIVYTPQEIVDFILSSVEGILRTEFDRTLGHSGVHVIDPFVGTGNFIVNLMRRLPKTRLEYKYRNELHCNEVMLLPYYVSAMNIEHTFWERTRHYEPSPGICLVDTFETAEKAQKEPESDLDVLVLVRTKDPALCRRIVEAALDADLAYDTNVAPTILTTTEYDLNREYRTPFYRNVEAEGRVL